MICPKKRVKMSIPYMPLYVTDYEGDTAHLTIEEDGAYMRLLRLCWRTPGCSVPDDPKWIMRKMRVSADDYYRVVEPMIDEFFTKGMGRVFHARLQREKDAIEATHKARSAAGKLGNKKRWEDGEKNKPLKTKENGNRPATFLQSQPKPEPEPLKRDTKVSPKSGPTAMPEGWFPDQAKAESLIEKYNLIPEELNLVFKRMKDECDAKNRRYKNWNLAFANWVGKSVEWGNIGPGSKFRRNASQSSGSAFD